MTILSDVKQALAGDIETPTNMDQLIGLCHEDLTSDELEIAKKNHPAAFVILEQPVGSITTLPESSEPTGSVVAVPPVEGDLLPVVVVTDGEAVKVETPATVVTERKARVSHKADATSTSDTTA